MSNNQKAVIILGADKLRIEMSLIEYFRENQFPSLFVRSDTEIIIDKEAHRAIEKEIGRRIYLSGEPEPIGVFNVNSYPTGNLLLYEAYNPKDWPHIDHVIGGVLDLLEEKGLECKPYLGRLPIEPKDLLEIEYISDDLYPQWQVKSGDIRAEEKKIKLLMSKEIMRDYYKDYSSFTAKEIIDAIPKAWKKHRSPRWGPGAISEYCGVTPTHVGRYLKAFWQAGVREIGGIQIPYRPRSNK